MGIHRRGLLWSLVAAAVVSVVVAGVVTWAAPAPVAPHAAAPCPPEPAAPKRQLRAMWIASVRNIDWPSRPGLSADAVRAEYRGWLDLAQRHHHNAVFVQVRPTADAFWPSRFEPWSGWLTGRGDGASPGWDPLAFLVAETHRRNLEFHAWFNPYRVSMPRGAGPDINKAGPDINKLAPGHPLRRHPEWAVVYPVNSAESQLYYNPGIPRVRRFVEAAILDAVARYDIDGVHLDDYFYPYPAAGRDFADDATYARYGTGFASRADWRRDNINRLIQELSGRVKELKPWVKFGVSPFGIWRNRSTDPLGSPTSGLQSYDTIYADTRLWVRRQWIDYLVPQLYWHLGFGPADYAVLVPWWSDVVSGTRVQLYIGQADHRIATTGAWRDATELTRHLTFNRGYPLVRGDVHFSAKDVRADRLGAVHRYVADHYARPALVPRLPRLPSAAPQIPVITRTSREVTGAVTLTWRFPQQRGPGAPGVPATSYAIYRFDGHTRADRCHFAAATHLLTTRRAGGGPQQSFTDHTARPGQRYTYHVSALDRIWTESDPSAPAFLCTDGPGGRCR